MKEFIRRVLYFIVIFVLINAVFIGIIIKTDWGFQKRLDSLRFNNPDFELLVLGNSLALDGIDAEYLTLNGMKSYNLALGGSTLKTNYIQLDEYLKKYIIKPQYIILGLGSYMGIDNSEEIHPIVEVTMNNYKFTLHDLPIIKFKWLGIELLKKIVSSQHRKAKVIYGQLRFQKIITDDTNYSSSYVDLQQFERSHWIGEIEKLCNQNKIKLIIIEMPGFKETQNLSEIGPHILHFANGVTSYLYNFNSQNFCVVFDSTRDWIGNSHLNEFGALKFTNELLKFLNDYIAVPHNR